MKKWIVSLQLVFLSALLISCSNTSTKAPVKKPADKKAAWEQRQAKFNTMKEWRLQGKVSIRRQSNNWPFNISWLQRGGDDYEMNIKHPLTGSVVVYLKSDSNGVMMKAQDGKVYRDTNAESLLQRQLNVSLPLDGLKYWVRGIPSPDEDAAKASLDDYGRPLTLLQAGWKVDYNTYKANGTYAFPEKIALTHAADGIRIKVVAKDWKERY